jgi:Resolvase, N terminal domain
MMIRTYCRRSKNDEGKQQFSLDVQAAGCRELIQQKQLGEYPVVPYVDDGVRAMTSRLAKLRDLLADAKRGDIIVCRDQSRLGRDAIEVTLGRARPGPRSRLPALLLCDWPRGIVRQCHRSGNNIHPGYRPSDGAGEHPLRYARSPEIARACRPDATRSLAGLTGHSSCWCSILHSTL